MSSAARPTSYSKAPPPPPPAPAATATTDSAWTPPGQLLQGTHYLLSGPKTGTLVVLVPGLGGVHFYYDPMAAALAENGYRVLRYDLMGRGFSDPPPKSTMRPNCFCIGVARHKDPYGMEGHVGQLRRLLVGLGLVQLEEVEERERAAALAAAAAALEKKEKETAAAAAGPSASGPPSSSSETEASSSSTTAEAQATSLADFPLPPQPFHIIGHSMGGCISMGYADQYPDDIASITLLTPAGLMDKGTFKLLRSLPCCIQDIVKRCLRRNTLNAVRNDFVQHYTELENRIVGQVKQMHTHNPHAFDAIFRSILAFPLSGLEGLISNVAAARPPILLVWAKWDRVVCLDPHFFRWKALLKTPMNVKYEVVDDAGHAFLLEKAEKTNGIVLRFLKNPPTWMPPALINQLSQHPPTITI